MSLKTKMLGLCALFSTVILIVGGIGYFSLVKVSKGYNWITSVTLGNIESNDQMYLRFRNVRIELKNLGIPGLSKEAGEKSMKLIDEAVQDYEKLQKEYFSTPFASKEEEDLANKQKEVWGHYKETADKIVALYRSGTADGQQKVSASLLKEEVEMAAPYNDIAVAIVKLQNADAKARSDQADAEGNFADILSLCTAILGIFVGLIFGYVFSSRLAKELGSTANQLGTGSKEVALASDQLSASSQKLASGASESAASLEEGVASIEELSSMVKMNAANAQQAATLSQQGSSEASMSLEEMSRLMTCMNSIHASSKKIEEIIGVIDDIAFQTNLLALNAAVEAARAGDQGKGFAVVADAVRALAQKSASSAKDISDLIKDSVQEVGKGVQIAQSNEAVLQKLSTSIKKISDLNQEISTASKEQSEGVNQLSVALNQLDKTVQGNAASAEEVAASAEELSAQSVLMRGNVDSLTSVVEGMPKKSEEKHKAPPTHVKHHNVVPLRSAPKKVAANHAIPFDDDVETAEPRSKIGTTDGF